jgi:hypothetical protein
MSRPPLPWDGIPAPTLPIARAACPQGHPSRRLREARGPIATTPACAALCARPGRPAEAPAPLARLTGRPCAAGRSDVPAAAAVRARLAWQEALALAWTAPGGEAAG